MRDKLLWWVEKLRRKGDYTYVLMKYVDRNYWTQKLQAVFPEYYFDNTTDFNYTSCYALSLNISPIHATFTSKEFYEYLEQNGVVYSIYIEISAIAPYALFRYQKRIYNSSPQSKIELSFTPYDQEQSQLGVRLRDFLEKEKLTILDEELMSLEIPDINLEMRDSHVQVYHCLFQDGYYYAE